MCCTRKNYFRITSSRIIRPRITRSRINSCGMARLSNKISSIGIVKCLNARKPDIIYGKISTVSAIIISTKKKDDNVGVPTATNMASS